MQREEQLQQQDKHWRVKKQLQQLRSIANEQFKLQVVEENNQRLVFKLYFKCQMPTTFQFLQIGSIEQCKYYELVMIINHQVYPFSPPYLVITDEFLFPKVNDFRNIIDDLFKQTKWWPTYTLQKIAQKVPEFLQGLKDHDIVFKGNYYYESPFLISDIQQFGKSLYLYKGLFLINKDSIIGKYHQKHFGISFDYIIIFKQIAENKLRVEKVVSMKKIKLLEMTQKKQYTKIKCHLSNSKSFLSGSEIVQFKIKTLQIPHSQMQQLLLIFNYFKLTKLNDQLKTLSLQSDNNNPQSQTMIKTKGLYKKKIDLISQLLQKSDQQNQNNFSSYLTRQLQMLLHDQAIVNILFPVL